MLLSTIKQMETVSEVTLTEEKIRNAYNSYSVSNFVCYGFKQIGITCFDKEKDKKFAYKLTDLGKICLKYKMYEKAIACFEESNAIYYNLDVSDDEINLINSLKLDNLKSIIVASKEINDYDSNKIIDTYNELSIIHSSGDNRDGTKYNECLTAISEIYQKNNNFNDALKILDKCDIESYTYKRILQKQAELLIRLEKYEDASQMYIKCITIHINNDTSNIPLECKELALMAVLCVIATKDLTKINDCYGIIEEKLINEFKNSFTTSSENKFIVSLIESIETNNMEMYKSACDKRNNSFPLTQIQEKLLNIGKELFTANNTANNIMTNTKLTMVNPDCDLSEENNIC